MDINKALSDLKMEYFYFRNCTIEREKDIVDGQYQMNLDKKIEKIEDHVFRVILDFSIMKDDLRVSVSALAKFCYEANDYSDEQVIIESNTVAIMFPFIRSEVTLLTSQPGMTPIVLPPINTAKLSV